MTVEQTENDSEPRGPHRYFMTTDKHIKPLVDAFECLPVLARLDYVSALVCDRIERDGDGTDEPELKAAWDILNRAVDVLRSVPDIDDLRFG